MLKMGIKSNRSKGEHLKPRTKKTRTPKNKGENKIAGLALSIKHLQENYDNQGYQGR